VSITSCPQKAVSLISFRLSAMDKAGILYLSCSYCTKKVAKLLLTLEGERFAYIVKDSAHSPQKPISPYEYHGDLIAWQSMK
jgi:hypothetical protein